MTVSLHTTDTPYPIERGNFPIPSQRSAPSPSANTLSFHCFLPSVHGRVPSGKLAPPATRRWPLLTPANEPANPTGSGTCGSCCQSKCPTVSLFSHACIMVKTITGNQMYLPLVISFVSSVSLLRAPEGSQ